MTTSILKKTTFLLSIISIFFACEKANIQTNTAIEEEALTVNFRTDDCDCDTKIANVESDGEMLYFASTEELFAVEECLKQRVDAHVAAFDEAHADLDDESFNELADELGFDENQPLRDQEAIWGITSLFTTLDDAFNQWLEESGEELDMTTYPCDHQILSEPLRALISSDGLVVVDEELQDLSPLANSNKKGDKEIVGLCKPNNYEYKGYTFNNGTHTQRMIVEGSVYQVWIYQRAGAKTRSLRLNNRGNFVNYRLRGIQSTISGNYRNTHCDGFLDDRHSNVQENHTSTAKRSHVMVGVKRDISTLPLGFLRRWLGDFHVRGRVSGNYNGYDL